MSGVPHCILTMKKLVYELKGEIWQIKIAPSSGRKIELLVLLKNIYLHVIS